MNDKLKNSDGKLQEFAEIPSNVKLKIVNRILCNQVVCGDYTDLPLKWTVLHLHPIGFLVLVFAPAQKCDVSKPFLQRCNTDDLSYHTTKDGFNSENHKDTKMWNSFSFVDKIVKAFKENQRQKFAVLVSSNNDDDDDVDYQFLETDDVAVICKQLLMLDHEAVCCIDDSTHQVKHAE